MKRLFGWMRIGVLDLRGDVRRFIVLLACLALGVAAISAVSSVGAALQSAVDRDARVILGGDIEVRHRGSDISQEQRDALDALGKVARVVDLNARASAGDASVLLSLRAVSDAYPLLGSVTVGPTTNQPLVELLAPANGLPGVVVAPSVLEQLGLSVGDVMRIGNADFAVRATLVALPDQAALGFQLGLPAIIADNALIAAGLSEQGVLGRFCYKVLLNGQEPAATIAELNKAFPRANWDLRLPEDAAANLKRFFELFARFLTLVGLSSLFVGGVGVSNAISAYINERRISIATLRSLGATSARIMVHFLTQLAILCLTGVLLGLSLGAATSLLALPVLSKMLALELPPSLDARSLLTAAIFGLLVGFTFALIPLRRAQGLKPASLFRAAGGEDTRLSWRDITHWGTALPLIISLGAIVGLAIVSTAAPWLVLWYILGTASGFALLRLAVWVLQTGLRFLPPPPNTTLRHAVTAIHRPGSPAPVVVLSLGLGLALLLMITLLDQNLRAQINTAVAQDSPAFVVLDMPKEQVPLLEAFAQADPDIASLSTIPMLRGSIATIKGRAASQLGPMPDDIADMFEGDTLLSWASELPDGSTVVEGQWWPSSYADAPLVSLSTELREPLGLAVGDSMSIVIAGRPLDVTIANFRDIDWRQGGPNFRLLFSPGVIEGAPQTVMAAISVIKGAAPQVQARLGKALPALTVLPVGDVLERIAAILASLANAVALVGSIAVLSGILVLAGAMTAGRKQREADAIVMKVLGATRGNVIITYMVEYGVLGLLSAAMGSALGLSAAWAIVTFVLEIPFAPNPKTVAIVVFSAVSITIATGVVTTWSAMSVRPAHQLRQDPG